MTKYGMVMDVTRCNGCYNCFLACRDEHCWNDFPPYSASQPHTGHYWMRLVETERGQYPKVKVAYTAVPCLQCEKPACVEATGSGTESGADDSLEPAAVYRRGDGIILIDPVRAAGRKDLVSSCPYRVIFWNEEKQLPQKCTFCAHLLDRGWKEPRCVEACPTRALVFGDLDDPGSEVARLVASGKTEVLRPEYEMADKVTYIGLPKRFVAGTVVFGDTDGCGEGAEITLRATGGLLPAGAAQSADGLQSVDGASGGTATRIVLADNYGDFEFEGLPSDETFTLKVEAAGYESRELFATTAADVYLGEIVLAPLDAAAGTGPGGARGAPRAASGRQGGTDTGGR
jgi:Fe-S-cluster-containing dehydrogenase component